MYVWIILATFISMLYAYNLSTREDMREIYVVPQAEVVVSKLMVQHRAARKYVEDHRPPDNHTTTVSFFPGEVKINDLQYYLPYGFVRDNSFTSVIYCLDKDSTNLSQSVSCTAGGASCCNDPKTIAYLVTFGCVPQRWRNVVNGKPNADLLRAIQSVAGQGTDLGYADAADSTRWTATETVKSTMAIRGREVTYTSIPQYIISNDIAGGKSFKNTCVNNTKCPYCLIYMTAYQ